MKKRLLVCIIAVMSMVMAVGCGSNGSDQQGQTDTQNQTQAADQTRAEDGTTVKEEELIGEKKAKSLALAKVDGATEANIYDFDLDRDNNRLEYEGEIRYNGMEYEFEIDARTGDFVKWEEEKEQD